MIQVLEIFQWVEQSYLWDLAVGLAINLLSLQVEQQMSLLQEQFHLLVLEIVEVDIALEFNLL